MDSTTAHILYPGLPRPRGCAATHSCPISALGAYFFAEKVRRRVGGGGAPLLWKVRHSVGASAQRYRRGLQSLLDLALRQSALPVARGLSLPSLSSSEPDCVTLVSVMWTEGGRRVLRRALTLALVSAGCGHAAVAKPALTGPSEPDYETVAHIDPVTEELTSPGATASMGEGPNWLRRLAEQDILTYVVQRGDERDGVTVQLVVQKLIRRGAGVAALLLPREPSADVASQPHWLVGDAGGLYRLEGHVDLAEPGIVPLDAEGHILGQSLSGVRWQFPSGWPARESAPDREGWQVEELELVLEGPVQGQRCARIRREDQGQATRITVCADLGMVETIRGDVESPVESWSLARIQRAPGSADGPPR